MRALSLSLPLPPSPPSFLPLFLCVCVHKVHMHFNERDLTFGPEQDVRLLYLTTNFLDSTVAHPDRLCNRNAINN